MVLPIVRKLPWYSVCCGGIVLHASSLLASICCDYRGMCRIRTTGRKRVLTASTKHSQPICFCLSFACYRVRRPGLDGLKMASPEEHLLCEFAAYHRHVRTHHDLQLWLWINIFLHRILDCSNGTSSRMDKRSLRRGKKCWSEQTGGTRCIFPIHHNQKQIFSN